MQQVHNHLLIASRVFVQVGLVFLLLLPVGETYAQGANHQTFAEKWNACATPYATQSKCREQLLLQDGTKEMCKSLETNSYSGCMLQLALLKEEPSFCKDLYYELSNNCYTQLAERLSNPSICNNIPIYFRGSKAIKGECIDKALHVKKTTEKRNFLWIFAVAAYLLCILAAIFHKNKSQYFGLALGISIGLLVMLNPSLGLLISPPTVWALMFTFFRDLGNSHFANFIPYLVINAVFYAYLFRYISRSKRRFLIGILIVAALTILYAAWFYAMARNASG